MCLLRCSSEFMGTGVMGGTEACVNTPVRHLPPGRLLFTFSWAEGLRWISLWPQWTCSRESAGHFHPAAGVAVLQCPFYPPPPPNRPIDLAHTTLGAFSPWRGSQQLPGP